MARVRVSSAPRRTEAFADGSGAGAGNAYRKPTRAPLVGTIGKSLELVFTEVVADQGSSSIQLVAADRYFDSAPRPDAEVVDAGAFSLFVSRTPWSYYARPAISDPKPATVADVEALIDRCEERDVDLAIEWVHEIHPELDRLAATIGLEVTHHALMVVTSGMPIGAAAIEGNVRLLSAEDPALLQAQAVAGVSFGAGGTGTGPAGAADREAAARNLVPELTAHLRDRARRRLTITAVAETDGGVMSAGSYQPVGDTAEILAVATLPVMRRRGLAAAVTAKLAQHARENGVRLLILSAQNDDVARVYERVGFHRIGTVCAAERPGT
jgi:GNAT superfamily N-acetyltransferase